MTTYTRENPPEFDEYGVYYCAETRTIYFSEKNQNIGPSYGYLRDYPFERLVDFGGNDRYSLTATFESYPDVEIFEAEDGGRDRMSISSVYIPQYTLPANIEVLEIGLFRTPDRTEQIYTGNESDNVFLVRAHFPAVEKYHHTDGRAYEALLQPLGGDDRVEFVIAKVKRPPGRLHGHFGGRWQRYGAIGQRP